MFYKVKKKVASKLRGFGLLWLHSGVDLACKNPSSAAVVIIIEHWKAGAKSLQG